MPELEAGVMIGVGTVLRASLELYRSDALHPEIVFLRISSKIRGERRKDLQILVNAFACERSLKVKHG